MSDNSLEGLDYVHFVLLKISNTTGSFPSDIKTSRGELSL